MNILVNYIANTSISSELKFIEMILIWRFIWKSSTQVSIVPCYIFVMVLFVIWKLYFLLLCSHSSIQKITEYKSKITATTEKKKCLCSTEDTIVKSMQLFIVCKWKEWNTLSLSYFGVVYLSIHDCSFQRFSNKG